MRSTVQLGRSVQKQPIITATSYSSVVNLNNEILGQIYGFSQGPWWFIIIQRDLIPGQVPICLRFTSTEEIRKKGIRKYEMPKGRVSFVLRLVCE